MLHAVSQPRTIVFNSIPRPSVATNYASSHPLAKTHTPPHDAGHNPLKSQPLPPFTPDGHEADECEAVNSSCSTSASTARVLWHHRRREALGRRHHPSRGRRGKTQEADDCEQATCSCSPSASPSRVRSCPLLGEPLGRRHHPTRGCRVRYTSFSQLFPLLGFGNLPELVKVEEISQTIDFENFTVQNCIKFSGPLATTSIATNAKFEIRSPKRVQPMLKNVRGKEIELDGMQCLRNKRMQFIRDVGNPTMKGKNNMLLKQRIIMMPHQIRKTWILQKQMIGSIGMIPTRPTILLMITCPHVYLVIKDVEIFYIFKNYILQ